MYLIFFYNALEKCYAVDKKKIDDDPVETLKRVIEDITNIIEELDNRSKGDKEE